jgi:hypothetical protein
MLSDVLIACIFQDHSLITIEKGLPYQPSRLKEYAINYESTYALDKIGIGICVLKTGRKKTSRMRIVRSGENLILVICNLNGMVEIIKLVPEWVPAKGLKPTKYLKGTSLSDAATEYFYQIPNPTKQVSKIKKSDIQ